MARRDATLEALLHLQEASLTLLDPDRSFDGGVRHVLALACEQLSLDAGWLIEWTGDGDRIRLAAGDLGAVGITEGALAGGRSVAVRLAEGRLPLAAAALRRSPFGPGTAAAAYIAAPVIRADGTLYGALVAAAGSPHARLGMREQAVLRVIARVVAGRVDLAPPGELAPETSTRIRALIADGGPAIALQPIVELASGATVGFEALARFPQYGSLTTVAWFEEAMLVGLGPDLEAAALRAGLGRLDALPPDAYLSLNVSPGTLVAIEADRVLDGFPADRLVVEITEHTPISDYRPVLRSAERLRERGLRLAIDDAGAGFASMRHVIDLRPDLIKLDMGLVRGIDRDPLRQALTASLVAFAATTDSPLVAEGVESVHELGVLARLGVEYGQGFLFGRPDAEPLAAVPVAVPEAPQP